MFPVMGVFARISKAMKSNNNMAHEYAIPMNPINGQPADSLSSIPQEEAPPPPVANDTAPDEEAPPRKFNFTPPQEPPPQPPAVPNIKFPAPPPGASDDGNKFKFTNTYVNAFKNSGE